MIYGRRGSEREEEKAGKYESEAMTLTNVTDRPTPFVPVSFWNPVAAAYLIFPFRTGASLPLSFQRHRPGPYAQN